MEIYERIKQRRKEIGLSAETVAEKLGVSPATIYRYENNDIKKFPTDILEPLSKVLRTTPAYLLGLEDKQLYSPEITDDIVTFPVIGSIAAGYDELAVEDWSGETVEIPVSYLKGHKKEVSSRTPPSEIINIKNKRSMAFYFCVTSLIILIAFKVLGKPIICEARFP